MKISTHLFHSAKLCISLKLLCSTKFLNQKIIKLRFSEISMKALLFHCKRYITKISRLSVRPKNLSPEPIRKKGWNCRDCIVVLLTVEKKDSIKKNCDELVREISKMSKEVGHKNIILLPFAHLSNRLADSGKSLKILVNLESLLKKDFNVIRSHFGSHKSLLLDIYGHPGNVRYREF